MRPGICVPETMRFDGTGWYTGTDEGNSSCDSRPAPPSWNKRNLTTGAEVGLNIWRQYLATDDRAFLEHNYPVMADAARFLLAYAVEGADGKLHTRPSNAHETQWDVTDPITDIAAMKALFPIVIEAATLLGQRRGAGHPAAGRDPEDPRLPAGRPATARRCSASARTRRPRFNNVENLDLEPLFPYNLISDQTPADFELSKATLRQPPLRQRQRLEPTTRSTPPACGNGVEVAARLRATTSSYQLFSNGLANLGAGGTLTNVYDEQVGIIALALNEALAQDFDGLAADRARGPARLERRGHGRPAAPLEGPRPGAGRRDHHRRARQRPDRPRHPRQEPVARPGRPGGQGRRRRRPSSCPRASAAIITIPAAANGTYLIQRPTAPTARAAQGRR